MTEMLNKAFNRKQTTQSVLVNNENNLLETLYNGVNPMVSITGKSFVFVIGT